MQIDLAQNAAEFSEREAQIARKLTPAFVQSMLSENADKIVPRLASDELSRHVTLIFATTHALLRRLEGDDKEKVVGIMFSSLREERKRQPHSKLLAQCDGGKQFCVTISTSLPLTLIGAGSDAVRTHTMTCLKLPFAPPVL